MKISRTEIGIEIEAADLAWCVRTLADVIQWSDYRGPLWIMGERVDASRSKIIVRNVPEPGLEVIEGIAEVVRATVAAEAVITPSAEAGEEVPRG